MRQSFCLKVDVDTHDGMRDGVPRLLNVFAEFNVKATFFLSFGPDNAGKAIWNVFRQPGFLRKMLKTKAPSLYGWRTIVSGTLLPARPIATSFPALVERIRDEGHELGVHAWDHRLWQDHLEELSPERIEEQLNQSFAAFHSMLGASPQAVAAPAWMATRQSLELQDRRGLIYASDMRGGRPGFLILDGYESKTLQIPSTAPAIEELLSLDELSVRDLQRPEGLDPRILERLTGGGDDSVSVLPIHAEVEGGPYLGVLRAMLKTAREGEREAMTMIDYARALLRSAASLPRRPAGLIAIPGRGGRCLQWL